MMGDGTEEQNLGQIGNRGARIAEDEVKEAFERSDAAGTDAPENTVHGPAAGGGSADGTA